MEVEPKSDDKIFISPYARKTALENGVDFNKIKGSGPRGRIVYDDIMNHISGSGAQVATHTQTQTSTPTPKIVISSSNIHTSSTSASTTQPNTQQATSSGFVNVDISNVRKIIAERLVLSKTTIPHFYVKVECNVDLVIK
jgi:pyruvate dehydrogenase E2 component (dihydrolipoamide acetyltransferase)